MRTLLAAALLLGSTFAAAELPDAPSATISNPAALSLSAPVTADAAAAKLDTDTSTVSSSKTLLITPAVTTVREDCTAAGPHTSACNFHWRKAFSESLGFLAMEHWMNTSTYKGELHGRFFHEWGRAVRNHNWGGWDDGDEFLVNYIGHPMSGATTSYIFIQNDPKGAALEVSASKEYFKSRMKAMAWSAVYSAQWEIGPLSEASLGHLGNFEYISRRNHKPTNGTGWCDFVNTPVIGTAWSVGEDTMDKYLIKRIETRSTNRALLMGISILTPTRSLSNLLRFKAPWYRDSRNVGSWAGVR